MQTSRVILANEPRLWRQMLRRVIGRVPGLEAVDEVTDEIGLRSALDQTEAQWIVVPIWPKGQVPGAVQSLLAEHASLCALGMAVDGSEARIACPDSTEETIHRLSLDELLAILHRTR